MAEASRWDFRRLLDGFNQLPNTRKVSLIVALAAAIALGTGALMWVQAPTYKILFSGLSDRDAGEISQALQTQNIPFTTENGVIKVPSGAVYDVRIKLASQGLPRGTVGFELMDKLKLGATDFVTNVTYQQALQGELARSIESLSPVQSARVLLAIPKPAVFLRDQPQPTASVTLTLHSGRHLDPTQVNGIVHLVAAAVPNMAPKNVTVVDQSSKLLSKTDDVSLTGLDQSQIDFRREMERGYEANIEKILAPLYGKDNIKAQVTAQLDFSKVEQTEETYTPNNKPETTAVIGEQLIEATDRPGTPAVGIPGAVSNTPPGAASAPLVAPGATGTAATSTAATTGSSRREVTRNYGVGKKVSHATLPVGKVTKLSVAVVVNYRTAMEKDKPVTKALTPVEVTQINNLVKGAVGFDDTRGDSINVVNAPFNDNRSQGGTPGFVDNLKERASTWDWYTIVRDVAVVLILLYIIFGVVRPILRDLVALAPKPEEEAQASVEKTEETMRDEAFQSYVSDLQAVKDLARQDPRMVASIVKTWVNASES